MMKKLFPANPLGQQFQNDGNCMQTQVKNASLVVSCRGNGSWWFQSIHKREHQAPSAPLSLHTERGELPCSFPEKRIPFQAISSMEF